MNDDTSVLFGLPGVRVQRVDLDEYGGRTVHVETAAGTSASGCPSCAVVSTSVKGNVITRPVDLPYGQGGLTVAWHKRRWRCREPSCERLSFTESITEVPARARTTGRLRTAVGAAIGDAARSVTEVAASFGVSWPTAHAAFIEHAEVLLTEPAPTTVLGIDETRRGKPRWVRDDEPASDPASDPDGASGTAAGRWKRVDPYDTGFVDLAGDQGLLGQREGRTSGCVVDWLEAQSEQFREAILFVAIDPAAVYAKAVRTVRPDGTLLLPNARLVVDHFHLVKLANDCVTKVRRRTIWEQKGRRGRKIDPAWANRRRLLTGQQRLRPKAFAAMWNSTDTEDQLRKVGMSKERRVDPQIQVGLLVDPAGFPLEVHCFAGNTAETTTLIPVLSAFQHRHGVTDMVVVADAGMLSAANLNALEDAGFAFIVGSRISRAPYDLAEHFARHGNYLPDGKVLESARIMGTGKNARTRRVVYQYRFKRAQRDNKSINAMIERAEKVADGSRPLKKDRFVRLDGTDKSVDWDLVERARQLVGLKGYVTNINAKTMAGQEVINAYHDLWQVERSFRMAKSDLRARPIFHHRRDSIEAHLSIVFAALAISRHLQDLTGMSIKKIVRTLRPLQTVTIDIR